MSEKRVTIDLYDLDWGPEFLDDIEKYIKDRRAMLARYEDKLRNDKA